MLPSIQSRLAAEVSARPQQIAAAVELLDEGATVPFIARYRKEATGGLDVSDTAPPLGPRTLANLSTRASLATHGDTLIVGFVVQGSGAKPLLLRAIGPGLAGFGVGNTLADPRITLVTSTGARIADNDNWSAGTDAGGLTSAFAATGAFALPAGSRDAALLVALPPGAYTALVRSADAVSFASPSNSLGLPTESPW